MKLKTQIVRFALLIVAVAFTFSCTEDDKKIVTRLDSAAGYLAANAGKYSILTEALRKTGLLVTLTNAGSYTIFAPSNPSFVAAGFTLESVTALNPLVPADVIRIANLRVILQNHVLTPGTRATDLVAGGYFRTFAFFRANAPLAPTPATALLTSGSQMSIFFNQVGGNVLINGGAANGGATVTTADIDLSNGILHEVDSVILLPTIVNLIVANPNLSTLRTVATSTSTGAFGDQSAVLNILTGATNLAARTIIAPNNTAFTAATTGSGFLTGTAFTPANVTRVLQYHVLPAGNRLNTFFTEGFVVNTSTTPNQTFTTFRVGTASFRIQDQALAPNNVSRSVLNDIQGVNGVLHIVDKVLQPNLN